MPQSPPLASLEAPDTESSEIRKLSTLLEASQALMSDPVLKSGLQHVLEILGHHHGAIRSAVVLMNGDTGDVELEAAAGAVAPNQPIGYRPCEGITGQVVATGRPVIVPQVNAEPRFLHRLADRSERARQELSYISVPITLDGVTIGALGIDLVFKPDRDYQRTAKFLGVVGSMIAHAVKVHRLVEADRQKLVDENQHLRLELKERYDYSNLVGTSGPMRRVYEQITQVARTNTTVLLRGESGTGKELIANAIHYNSSRARKPLVKVNCA
jgi:Nif-specific regulatory protein